MGGGQSAFSETELEGKEKMRTLRVTSHMNSLKRSIYAIYIFLDSWPPDNKTPWD